MSTVKIFFTIDEYNKYIRESDLLKRDMTIYANIASDATHVVEAQIPVKQVKEIQADGTVVINFFLKR